MKRTVLAPLNNANGDPITPWYPQVRDARKPLAEEAEARRPWRAASTWQTSDLGARPVSFPSRGTTRGNPLLGLEDGRPLELAESVAADGSRSRCDPLEPDERSARFLA